MGESSLSTFDALAKKKGPLIRKSAGLCFLDPAEVQTKFARTVAFDQLAADIQYRQ
jgi:hypothetical protein